MKNSEEIFGSVYERGSVVFRQGDIGDSIYIIQTGAVEISKIENGVESVLTILEKGDFFGEMAVFKKDVRTATVVAARRTRLLKLTKESLQDRIKDAPSVALHILKGLIGRIQKANLKFQQTLQDIESIFSDEDPEDDFDEDFSTEEDFDQNSSDVKKIESQENFEKSSKSDSCEDDEHKEASFEVSVGELSEIWETKGITTKFRAGELIFSEGDSGDHMYVILKGSVEVSLGAGEDKQTLAFLKRGDFFGEMAVISNIPRSATATAIEPCQVIAIEKNSLASKFQQAPELLLYIIESLCFRLQRMNTMLMNPKASIDMFRQNWRPLLKKSEPLKISIISLSTCAGCSATLFDNEILNKISEKAEIVYCPMLMDVDKIPEADIALVDGVARLKEDQETLEEAREKSRFLIAWGSCSCFGGIPAEANKHNLESLIEATYGGANDAFAYYLSGKEGAGSKAYRKEGMALLRKAYKLADFVKVDYHLPGCPPNHEFLLTLINELTGEEIKVNQATVCKQCGRRSDKSRVESFEAFPNGEAEFKCLNSNGVLCMGFLMKGGCGAICPQHGLPCWGCRGPAKLALKKMIQGNSFEEALLEALSKRCKTEESSIKASIKLIRRQSCNLFNFEMNSSNYITSVR